MPTANPSSASVPAGVLGTPKLCSECDNPIHPARLARHPDTELCARCQEQVEDVAVVTDRPRASYGGSHLAAFSMLFPKGDRDLEQRRTRRMIKSLTWNELRPHRDDTGNANNTGLHVNSEHGIEIRRDNGRKSWVNRKAR